MYFTCPKNLKCCSVAAYFTRNVLENNYVLLISRVTKKKIYILFISKQYIKAINDSFEAYLGEIMEIFNYS